LILYGADLPASSSQQEVFQYVSVQQLIPQERGDIQSVIFKHSEKSFLVELDDRISWLQPGL
jgi:hypothetical protein